MRLFNRVIGKTLKSSLNNAGFCEQFVPKSSVYESERFSEEDLENLSERVKNFYRESGNDGKELYIAPGHIFGNDKPFVFYVRDSR